MLVNKNIYLHQFLFFSFLFVLLFIYIFGAFHSATLDLRQTDVAIFPIINTILTLDLYQPKVSPDSRVDIRYNMGKCNNLLFKYVMLIIFIYLLQQ